MLTEYFQCLFCSVTVPLSNDSFWSSQKSQFTGRSHREEFEVSLQEIYKNIYATALTQPKY